MTSFIARTILWFVFAFILFDTINEFNRLFALSFSPYFAISAAVFVYGFQEFMLRKKTANKKAATNDDVPESVISRVAYVSVWTIVASLILGIFIVWAGVIYKQIIQ